MSFIINSLFIRFYVFTVIKIVHNFCYLSMIQESNALLTYRLPIIKFKSMFGFFSLTWDFMTYSSKLPLTCPKYLPKCLFQSVSFNFSPFSLNEYLSILKLQYFPIETISPMSEIAYWLAGIYKRGAQNVLISKGFLLLYISEVALFFSAFTIHYQTQSGQDSQYNPFFSLVRLVIEVFYLALFTLVVAYTLTQKEHIAKHFDVPSVVFVGFGWLAMILVGIISLTSHKNRAQNIKNFEQLSYGLAWVTCLFKFIIQHKINVETQSIGFSGVFHVLAMCWAVCEIMSKILASQNEMNIVMKITTVVLCSFLIGMNVIMMQFKRQYMKNSQRNQEIQQAQNHKSKSGQVCIKEQGNDNRLDSEHNNGSGMLEDSLLGKRKKSESTRYASSFAQSRTDNY